MINDDDLLVKRDIAQGKRRKVDVAFQSVKGRDGGETLGGVGGACARGKHKTCKGI